MQISNEPCSSGLKGKAETRGWEGWNDGMMDRNLQHVSRLNQKDPATPYSILRYYTVPTELLIWGFDSGGLTDSDSLIGTSSSMAIFVMSNFRSNTRLVLCRPGHTTLPSLFLFLPQSHSEFGK